MSKVEAVFSRLLSKLEQMSTDELDTQLKKHECAGGPTVEVFLNDYCFSEHDLAFAALSGQDVSYPKTFRVAGGQDGFYSSSYGSNLENAA